MVAERGSVKDPIVHIEHAINVNLNLDEHCETAGTQDGINLYPDRGDGYIITPEQLREIAGKLIAAADEWEALPQ